jgi:hypothetical protein
VRINDNTSCYFDSVIVQFIEKEHNKTGKGWKVQRYRHEPVYFRTKDEAYQAAIQLYFNALAEEI